MAGQRDVRKRLEAILGLHLTPEEVCRGDPELMAHVRARPRHPRRVEDQLDARPPPSSPPVDSPAARRPWIAEPPREMASPAKKR
jgi:hypothetical protein